MKALLKYTLLAVLAVTMFTGCMTRPIKTTLDLSTEPAPSLNYSSEKDVVYTRTVTNPNTGVVETVSFQAISSAPAYAQAERDRVQAEANAVNAKIGLEAIKALSDAAIQQTSP